MARIRIYTRNISASFTDDMYNQLKNVTDKKEISISEYIRIAVSMLLEKANDRTTDNSLKEGAWK